MRISDWSSDVCSSDLEELGPTPNRRGTSVSFVPDPDKVPALEAYMDQLRRDQDSVGARKSVVSGKSVSVRVDLGGSRISNKKIDITRNKIRNILIAIQRQTVV